MHTFRANMEISIHLNAEDRSDENKIGIFM